MTEQALESSGFETLVASQTIKDALQRLKITTPTPVQLATIPAAGEGLDLIIQAKTGSGKTLAFVLPLLKLLETHSNDHSTFGVIITPTRELAVQIVAAINSIAPEVQPACLIGGVSIRQQVAQLEASHKIVVGTPGRFIDHLHQRTIILRKCQYLVLDEADEMLSLDFLEAVTEILSRLPPKCQKLFVSATITPRVESLARSFLNNPQRIIVDSSTEELPAISHRYCEVSGELVAKMSALCDILETENPKSAMIFCNTRSDTDLVEKFLRRRGFDARCLNSELDQKQREYVMGKIRAQELRYLVGTDIAARGIDIEQIELVINYAIPEQSEVYIHRIGRTGRAGRTGKAISLIGPQDFTAFGNLKRYLSFELEKFTLPSETEVLEARLKHFHRLLGEADVEIHSRDIALAEELLRRNGVATPSTELTNTIGRLCRFSLDHFLNFQAKSLEEEMREVRGQRPQREEGDRRGRERRHDRGRHDRGGHRNRRR